MTVKFDKLVTIFFILTSALTIDAQTADTLKTNKTIKKINGHYRLTAIKYGLDYIFHSQPGLHLGLMQYNYESFDNYGVHPVAVWGPSAQTDFSYDFATMTPILKSKISYEYNIIFGFYSGFKISVGHLTDFKNQTAIISPEIGICLPGRYGNNVRGSRHLSFGLDIPVFDKNKFPIYYRLTMNINRALKPKGMN